MIYSININEAVSIAWLNWMKNTHIPKMLNTGCFVKSNIYEILAEKEGGLSYSIQYMCKNIDLYNLYMKKYAQDL